LSIVTSTAAEDFTVEFDVTGILPTWSPSDVSLVAPDSSWGTSPSCWITSPTTLGAFGAHMSRPKHPIFVGTSGRTTSARLPSDDRDPGCPLTLVTVVVQSQEVLSGVEMI